MPTHDAKQNLFFPHSWQLPEKRTQQTVAQMRPQLLNITRFCYSWRFMRRSPTFAYEKFRDTAQWSSRLWIMATKRLCIFVRSLPVLRWQTRQTGKTTDTPVHGRNGSSAKSCIAESVPGYC